MKSSKLIRALVALEFSRVPGQSVVVSWRSPKNLCGEDHPERGNARGWVIFALLSVVVIAALLATAGPPLIALVTQLMEKARW